MRETKEEHGVTWLQQALAGAAKHADDIARARNGADWKFKIPSDAAGGLERLEFKMGTPKAVCVNVARLG